jgi:hypothetical protein
MVVEQDPQELSRSIGRNLPEKDRRFATQGV